MSREMNPTILGVDDERKFLDNVEKLISIECNFLKAENEADTIMYLNQHSVDLILLDQTLKGSLGSELLKKVVKVFPTIDVIFVSISPQNEISPLVKELNLNIRAYFQKPISPLDGYDKLNSLISEVLDNPLKKQMEQSNTSYTEEPNIINKSIGYLERCIDEYAYVILDADSETPYKGTVPRDLLESNKIYEGMNFSIESLIVDKTIVTKFSRIQEPKEFSKFKEQLEKEITFDWGD